MNDATGHHVDLMPGPGLPIQPGRKLASGRDADVFEVGDGQVLRRNRVPTKTSELEAEIMRYARSQGYPVPAVYEVSGPDMVMERVDGPTMLADIIRRPWMTWRHARTLARLHGRLHRIAAPSWVPKYTDLKVFADAAPSVRPAEAAFETLLHLDLHPDNVILSPRGPAVIDWRNTRRGDGAIDVATTWLIMATSEVPMSGLTGQLVNLIRHLFVFGLLHYSDRAAATHQIPTVAHYRLADANLLPSERPAIEALARRIAAPSRLLH